MSVLVSLMMKCLAAFTVWAAVVLPVRALSDPLPAKPFSTTTVFFVTDQSPSSRGVENGFDDDRYAFTIDSCADKNVSWTESCGLRYGFVYWDENNWPVYKTLSQREFFKLVGTPARAFMFLHGFNERFSDAIEDGREFASWLDYETRERGDVPVIVYGWPAVAATFSRATFAGEYPNDETNNAWSRLHLLAFYREFRQNSPETRLSLAAHSLGNRLALDMLFSLREEHLGAHNSSPSSSVAHLISLEPDVDTQTYAESINVLQGSGTVDDVTVYGNPQDVALNLSAHLHAHCRAGLIDCEPLYVGQFKGDPMPPWLNVIDAQMLARACDPQFYHTYYRYSTLMLSDIAGLVLGRTHLMKKDALRQHMHYSDILAKHTIPHFWIESKGCM